MKYLLLSILIFSLISCTKKQESSIDITKLKGKWALGQDTLLIGDSTISYLNLKQTHKYETKYDTLIYVYFDMDTAVQIHEFGIRKLNDEELKIDNGSATLWDYRRIH